MLAHKQEQLMQEEPIDEEANEQRIKDLEEIEQKMKDISMGLRSGLAEEAEPEKSLSKFKECPNCTNMIKTNAELIGKLKKFEAER